MQCQICMTQRKPRFTTSRISICQNCINVLCETSVSFEDIERQIWDAVLRVCPYSDRYDILKEVKEIERAKNNFFINIFNDIFRDDITSKEINRITDIKYKNMIKDIDEKRRQLLNNILYNGYIPKESYFYINKKFMRYGYGEKNAFNKWEITLIRRCRAFAKNLIYRDASIHERLNVYDSISLSNKIKKMDGFECNLCHKKGHNIELHVHHIIPISKGGTNHDNNLIVLCQKCHQKQHPDFKISKNKS